MTVTTTQSRILYAGDGVTLAFPIPFEFFLNTDISAIVTQNASSAATPLNYGPDFLLSGAGVPAGGTLNKTTVVPVGSTLVIYLNPPLTQQSVYAQNNPFPALTLMTDLDRQTQISQRLQDQISRALRAPDGDLAPVMLLPNATLRINTNLGFDNNGNVAVNQQLQGSVLSAAAIGAFIRPPVAAEGASVVNAWYDYGVPERYGADGTGVADSSAAFTAMWAAFPYTQGNPNSIYKIAATVTLPKDFVFDGRGCTIRLTGTSQWNRTSPAPTASTTVTDAREGQLNVIVASNAGLVIGQYLQLVDQNWATGAGSNNFPAHWAQIRNIVGTTVTLDRALKVTYCANTNSSGVLAWQASTAYIQGDFVTNGGYVYMCSIAGTSGVSTGPASLPNGTTSQAAIVDNTASWIWCSNTNAYAYSATGVLGERAHIANVEWDGQLAVGVGASLGVIAHLGGYKSVRVQRNRVFNYNINGANQANFFECTYGIDAGVIDNVIEECLAANTVPSGGVFFDIQHYRTAILADNRLMGQSFGCDMSWNEDATAIGNILNGTASWENFTGTTIIWSARGIKGTSNANFVCNSNISNDYESPLRTFGAFSATFEGNQVRNARWPQAGNVSTGGIAINLGAVYFPFQRYLRVVNNLIENCGGAAIGGSSGLNTTWRNSAQFIGNVIKRCNSYGIYNPDQGAVAIGNIVEDWDLSASGAAAMHFGPGYTAIGNRFRHNTDATRWCLRNPNAATMGVVATYTIYGNVPETSNPLFQTSTMVMEGALGTTIAAASTNTGLQNHNLPTTPDAGMFTVNVTGLPTNAPRMTYITGITSTQFQVNTDAVPGASGLPLSIRWRLPAVFSA